MVPLAPDPSGSEHGGKGVASSAVEHSAFNRLVLSSNLRRPMEEPAVLPVDKTGLKFNPKIN